MDDEGSPEKDSREFRKLCVNDSRLLRKMSWFDCRKPAKRAFTLPAPPPTFTLLLPASTLSDD
jgi:hypothetical protein